MMPIFSFLFFPFSDDFLPGVFPGLSDGFDPVVFSAFTDDFCPVAFPVFAPSWARQPTTIRIIIAASIEYLNSFPSIGHNI